MDSYSYDVAPFLFFFLFFFLRVRVRRVLHLHLRIRSLPILPHFPPSGNIVPGVTQQSKLNLAVNESPSPPELRIISSSMKALKVVKKNFFS